jgi:DNA-binding CsgD family transcriptional regulator
VALNGATRRSPLVGRAAELDALVELAQGAARGRAGARIVSGEAGVGKTALLREGCRRVADQADVLWAPCLPLTSLAVPFLPLASALREWAAERGVAMPVLGQAEGRAEGDAAVEFDAWLTEACRQRAVVLVVDDVHWADQSSLDVLMYAIAGPTQRRLAVAATVREEEVGPTHPLRRWLADVRRLPGVAEMRLPRLDRLATAQQLAELLGTQPHQSLVDDVFARTGGNPYQTNLLVRGLPPNATSLPANLPTDLRDAIARAWYALSPPARELTRLIAVAGHPQRADQLRDVTTRTRPGADLVPLLREAVDGGVLDVPVDGRYWFRHPLLAEVLVEGLLPEERRAYHASFATALELRQSDDADVEHVVDLADHHFRAGHVKDAYRWALLGAEAAEQVGGGTEMLRLLRRALDLWPQVPEPGESNEELLLSIRDAAARAGEFKEELAAVDDLLAALDWDRQPLRVSELLVRRMHLRFLTGRDFFPVADMHQAVELAAVDRQSAEYALAVAELVDAELWHDVPTAPARAEEAVRLARTCGSDRPLTYALVAWVMAQTMTIEAGRFDAGVAVAEEARAAAARNRDFFGFVHATLWAANCLEGDVSWEHGDYLHRSHEQMTRLGAPHAYVAWVCAVEAHGLLLLGDWRGCEERLRVALGSPPGPLGDIDARLAAALQACWQGKPDEADAHLARAEELFAEKSGFLTNDFDAVRAELSVASGHTEQAISAALAGLQQDATPTRAERLVPLAARAMANDAQALRDHDVDPSAAVARLDDLRRRYPNVVADVGAELPIYRLQLRAMQALYDAELCRGRRDPGAGAAWLAAADACHEGLLAWDEAYAAWRAAEALLSDRANRDAGVAALRRAHALAIDLQAAPLLAEIDALAVNARVPTTAVANVVPVDDNAVISGLTPREREILTHVVAGRTYAEIARALVISEKTVSVHVSNILRKTGTANRVELTQLARRLTSPAQGRR